MIKITIDSREIVCEAGKTILQIAHQNGIDISSLCHDERLEMYGSCGICTVEIAGNPRLIRACSTVAQDGIVITTDSERIRANRRLVLELLLSDHSGDCKAPCTLACPAGTDCQGYVKAIADGDGLKAWERVREKVPFPASIGRVCPRPCEDACRRQLADEPIAIANLKQFVGDMPVVDNELSAVDNCPGLNTAKSVAIAGGGPGGLSAAYYLRLKGHSVTVFDAMPQMGGMLRYGIPEYRLPKAVLQKEIDLIEKSGVEFRNNTRVTLDELQGKYDAVIVAIGAWSSAALRCKGEESKGVIGGIDYLRSPFDLSGKTVAVVGGGNTAMDACRTAVRMDANKVYCVYRRTRNEMPADDSEITEAEEEGVIFKFLTAPIEVAGSIQPPSKLNLHLQIMQLGEPDSSGRRAPVPVEGEVETLPVDFVISAIGQKPNLNGFEMLEKTKWGTIAADEKTFLTNVPKVFAIGDAINNGADIAISAIGAGGRCAGIVDKFLNGEVLQTPDLYLSKDKKTPADFAAVEKQPRVRVKHRPPSERSKDFGETYTIFDLEAAQKEAKRCLECGCSAFGDRSCKLIRYANQYGVNPEKYGGNTNKYLVDNSDHDEIIRNPEKCILCGLCVRTCEQVEKITALGFAGRGFDTAVKPALNKRLKDAGCNSCGKCVEVCPTGAFTKKL